MAGAAGPIVDAALALSPLPRVIWMQLGVRNDEAAARAEAIWRPSAMAGLIGNVINRGLRVAVNAVEADRDLVRQDLRSIQSVNETLIKQVALLESRNRELHARLALTSL